jgi:hypothetical protein
MIDTFKIEKLDIDQHQVAISFVQFEENLNLKL